MPNKLSPSLFIAAIVCIVVSGGTAWWITQDANPTAVVPMPVMPSPNAFDDFVAAGNAVADKKDVDAASVDTGAGAATLAVKQAAVAANRTALARLKIGLTKTYWAPPVRSISDSFSYYARFREMARLLRTEAQVKAARGDWNGAVQSDLDGMRLGVMLPHGSGLIGMLVGVACEAICRKDLWSYLPHLSAAQAKSAALRLEAIDEDRFTFGATMQEEKWTMQASLLELFRQGNIVKTMREVLGPDGMGGGSVPFDPGYLIYSKRTMFSNVTKGFDAAIRIGTMPYYQAVRATRPPLPKDPISKIVLPVFGSGRLRLTETQAEDELLITACALHAYRLDHHADPDKLSQLAPAYLTRAPDDPFASSGSLRYQNKRASGLLYSVGPDGIDDGGKPIPESPTGSHRFVDESSIGDIVAGVTVH